MTKIIEWVTGNPKKMSAIISALVILAGAFGLKQKLGCVAPVVDAVVDASAAVAPVDVKK